MTDPSRYCRNRRHRDCARMWGDQRGRVPPTVCGCRCHHERDEMQRRFLQVIIEEKIHQSWYQPFASITTSGEDT